MAETAKRPYLIFYRADISQIYRRYSPTKNTYLHVGLGKGTLRIKACVVTLSTESLLREKQIFA